LAPDLQVFAVGRHLLQHDPAEQGAIGVSLDGPVADRGKRLLVLADPDAEQLAHLGDARGTGDGRMQPSRHLGMVVDLPRLLGVGLTPRTQSQPVRGERVGHPGPPPRVATARPSVQGYGRSPAGTARSVRLDALVVVYPL